MTILTAEDAKDAGLEVVAEILGRPTTDAAVLRCVLSIQSQVHAAMPNSLSKRLWPDLVADRRALEQLADHIAEFSLGGLRAITGGSSPNG